MMAVEEGLHTRFDGNRSGWDKSHSTCVNLKKAHSLPSIIAEITVLV
jgi:hypothetical protein